MTYFKNCEGRTLQATLSSGRIRIQATNGRREDYIRLPFVDGLCLRGAMQGFLEENPPAEQN